MSLDIASEDSPISIGRSSGSDVLLGGKLASRHHAEIYWEARQWWVRDVGSFNGTFLDGRRVLRPTTLAHHAVVRCSDVPVSFSWPGAIAAGPASSQPVTVPGPKPPLLTATELEILKILCRPVLDGSGPPPDNPTIATLLNIDLGGVRQRLRRMYPKFDLLGSDADKRDALVARAIETGAVFSDGV